MNKISSFYVYISEVFPVRETPLDEAEEKLKMSAEGISSELYLFARASGKPVFIIKSFQPCTYNSGQTGFVYGIKTYQGETFRASLVITFRRDGLVDMELSYSHGEQVIDGKFCGVDNPSLEPLADPITGYFKGESGEFLEALRKFSDSG